MTSMIPDVSKPVIEEKSREELIAIIHELMAEIERLKGGRTNSRNSSQPPSATIMTDKFSIYNGLDEEFAGHEVVDHVAGEYMKVTPTQTPLKVGSRFSNAV